MPSAYGNNLSIAQIPSKKGPLNMGISSQLLQFPHESAFSIWEDVFFCNYSHIKSIFSYGTFFNSRNCPSFKWVCFKRKHSEVVFPPGQLGNYPAKPGQIHANPGEPGRTPAKPRKIPDKMIDK